MSDTDPLAGFTRSSFTHEGKERDVYRLGSGPAVIVIAEMPGITPDVLGFARTVAGIGCSAVLPHLFGEPGREPFTKGLRSALPYVLSSMGPACVRREFAVWGTGRTSPVTTWLRALARAEHERCGGPGVGAVGMCFTGGFALGMAVDPVILAPVLSQPSLPFPVTPAARRSIDTSPEDLEVVRRRCDAEGLQVLGLRFTGDRAVPAARFRMLAERLGDGFVAVELPSSTARRGAPGPAHSVLTTHLDPTPGSPTQLALEQVLDLLRRRLLLDPPA